MGAEHSGITGEIRRVPVDRPRGPGVFRLAEYYDQWTHSIKRAAATLQIDTNFSYFGDLAPRLETETYKRAAQRGRPYRFVILVGTQNVGKTAIRDQLIEDHGFANFRNHVTRPPRPTEQNGISAHFVSEADLDTMQQNGDLIAPPRIQSHSRRETDYRSAASKKEFVDLLSSPTPFVMERRLESWDSIADNLRTMPGIDPKDIDDALIVCLLPPSLDTLTERVVKKATGISGEIDGDEINKQLERTFGTEKAEMLPTAAARPDVVFIVNDIRERTSDTIAALVKKDWEVKRRRAA